MINSRALSVSNIILNFTAVVQAQNSTASTTNSADVKVGWQDGPNQRGTSTLVWNSLSTAIACTWTILHLNVPRQSDSVWIKVCRKAKWMIITILFPEFVFSKAICELQMAVDDLEAMKKKDNLINWRWTLVVVCNFCTRCSIFSAVYLPRRRCDGAYPGL
jgi:hypothetical protein